MQRVKTGIHQSLIVGNRTRAILLIELCHVLRSFIHYRVTFSDILGVVRKRL